MAPTRCAWGRFGPGHGGYHQGMGVVVLVLLIAAAVCFLLAAANVPTRVGLVPLGLLLWVLTALIPAVAAAT